MAPTQPQSLPEGPDEPVGRIRLAHRRQLKPVLAALASAGFDFRVEYVRGRPVVLVHPDEEERARTELAAVRSENRGWPPTGRETEENALATAGDYDAEFASSLAVLALLFAFVLTGPYSSDIPLLAQAAADAEGILAGEWWRLFTAMTLHSGFPHLFGNALAALFLGMAAGHLCGHGAAWLLIVLSGAAANLATAWTVSPPFVAVGASTGTFAALGIATSGQAMRNYFRHGRIRDIWHRSFVAIGAGVALLGILGTGEGADLRGHLYGFLFGALVGAPAVLAKSAKWSKPVQWGLFALAGLLVVLAWRAAAGGQP